MSEYTAVDQFPTHREYYFSKNIIKFSSFTKMVMHFSATDGYGLFMKNITRYPSKSINAVTSVPRIP